MFCTLETVKAFRGVVEPKFPPKTILPVPADKVRVLFPSIVLENVILPAPEPVDKVETPAKVIGLAKEMF